PIWRAASAVRAVTPAERASLIRSAENGIITTMTAASGTTSRRLSFCRIPSLESIATLPHPWPNRPSDVDKLLGVEQIPRRRQRPEHVVRGPGRGVTVGLLAPGSAEREQPQHH